MIRSEILKEIAPILRDQLVICNIGIPSQELHAIDGDAVVFQKMHLLAQRRFADVIQRSHPMAVIQLVVARHQHHGLVGKSLARPHCRLGTVVNIAGQHHHIGRIDDLRIGRKGRHFNVQIRENKKLHTGPSSGKTSAATIPDLDPRPRPVCPAHESCHSHGLFVLTRPKYKRRKMTEHLAP